MSERVGILYAATGRKFLAEAEISAKSAKESMLNIPIALISDCESNSSCFDMKLKIERPKYSFIDKILALKETPFDKTLYLDSDTFVLSDVRGLFDLLDRFEMAASFEPARFLSRIDGVPTCFSEINTGVILYKSEKKVFDLIDKWHRLYSEEITRMVELGKKAWHDQFAFTQAVFESDIYFYILPPEYNARMLLPLQASGSIKIVHSRLKHPCDYKEIFKFINEREDTVRIFNPNPRRILEFSLATWRLFRLLYRGR